MPTLILKVRAPSRLPLDVNVISPTHLAGKSTSEIEKLEVIRGNRRIPLGDVFQVSGQAGATAKETDITVEGDLATARRLGMGMDSGSITVNGAVGLYLGEKMTGGKILVHGNVDSWAGIDMRGGLIEIFGNTGDCLGSAYRGTRAAMRSGVIIVHGDAGNEAGSWMKDGLIKIEGNAGAFAGIHMEGGNILVRGHTQGRVGASMTAGKVVVLGNVPSILPSFHIDDLKPKTKVGDEEIAGPFYCFVGDLAEGGDGRLYVSVKQNPHLKDWEQYIAKTGSDEP